MRTLLPVGLLVFTACGGYQLSKSFSPVTNADTGHQVFSKALTVCNPLDDDNFPQVEERNGLQGKLYYLTPDMPRFTTVEDYVRAIDTGTTVFLNDVNVPTRMFDRGFPTAGGQLLKANNETLVEWFELFVDTQIKLMQDDSEGAYQFALLADDGATFEINSNDDNFSMFINNDGTHSSRLACATTTLDFNAATRLPARIKYYQGPRTEIALMLLWRKIPVGASLAEPMCGQTGQDLYFRYYDNPVTPQQTYIDMLARGWAPLRPGNFLLPGQNRINPCNSEDHWADDDLRNF